MKTFFKLTLNVGTSTGYEANNMKKILNVK